MDRRKFVTVLIAFLMVILGIASLCTGCGSGQSDEQERQNTAVTEESQSSDVDLPDRHGVYDSKDEVAAYLYAYGELPENYMTKRDAQALGWHGGSLERYAPGMCIGGDRFGNYEKLLPTGQEYHECDIDTLGSSERGAKRLVYSEDDIYYTEDHYGSFEQLYDENGRL